MEDSQLGELLRFRTESIDYKDVRFSEEWEENMAFYFGEQYDADYLDAIAMWRSATIQNIIYPTVEQLHALMTDDESIAFVQREAGGTYQVERILDSIVKQVWDKEDVLSELSLVDKDRLLYGTGFIKVNYDKHSKKFLKIDVKRISPWDFYPDRSAKKIEDCRFVFERERTTKAALLERYPDKYDIIIGAEGNAVNPIGVEGNSKFSTAYENESVFIWHCYINELAEEESEIDSAEAVKKIVRSSPNGEYIVLLGDVILEEAPNKHNFFPYIRLPLIEIPDEFFAMSIVTPMKMPQEELNKTESMLLDNLKSNVNPIFRVTEGILDEEFVPTPNSMVTLRDSNDIFDKLPGTQLPSEVFAMMSQKKTEVMSSAGVNDVTFGQGAQSSRPGTVRANFNASITRIREYLRLKHRAVSTIGKYIIDIVQNQVPAGTTISMANKDDIIFDLGDTETAKDLAEALQDKNITKNLEIQNIVINEQSDEFKQQLEALIGQGQGDVIFSQEEARKILLKKGVGEFKNDVREGEYTYMINTHPLTVNDPDKMMELVQMLLQYGSANPETGSPGIIDFEFVLEQLPLKGKDALISRLKKKQKILEQQQQAQAQAQAQQQGGQPNGQQGQ